jgi:hypothetical protein
MTKGIRILISISMIILGWTLNAIAWTTMDGPTISSMCLLLGLGLFIGGTVYLIKNLNGKK